MLKVIFIQPEKLRRGFWHKRRYFCPKAQTITWTQLFSNTGKEEGAFTLSEKGPEKTRVAEILNKVRPGLQADGGDVELVDVEGGVVKVKLRGTCAGCPMSQLTVKNGIERILKAEIPEVSEVRSV